MFKKTKFYQKFNNYKQYKYPKQDKSELIKLWDVSYRNRNFNRNFLHFNTVSVRYLIYVLDFSFYTIFFVN